MELNRSPQGATRNIFANFPILNRQAKSSVIYVRVKPENRSFITQKAKEYGISHSLVLDLLLDNVRAEMAEMTSAAATNKDTTTTKASASKAEATAAAQWGTSTKKKQGRPKKAGASASSIAKLNAAVAAVSPKVISEKRRPGRPKKPAAATSA